MGEPKPAAASCWEGRICSSESEFVSLFLIEWKLRDRDENLLAVVSFHEDKTGCDFDWAPFVLEEPWVRLLKALNRGCKAGTEHAITAMFCSSLLDVRVCRTKALIEDNTYTPHKLTVTPFQVISPWVKSAKWAILTMQHMAVLYTTRV